MVLHTVNAQMRSHTNFNSIPSNISQTRVCTSWRLCLRKRQRRSARTREVPRCASVRVRFTAIGSQDYSETAIQRKARFVFWSSTREERLRKLRRQSATEKSRAVLLRVWFPRVPKTILRLPYKRKQGLQRDHGLFLPTLSLHISHRALPERSFKTDDRKRENSHRASETAAQREAMLYSDC